MHTIEDIAQLTGDMKAAVRKWAYHKVDELAAGRPKLKAASVYIKRGIDNYMARVDKRVNSMIDSIALFVADEHGNIDTDILLNDAISIFKEMDIAYTEVGIFGIEYGRGAVTINVPHNVLLDMIFGDLGKITITADDLAELKELLR